VIHIVYEHRKDGHEVRRVIYGAYHDATDAHKRMEEVAEQRKEELSSEAFGEARIEHRGGYISIAHGMGDHAGIGITKLPIDRGIEKEITIYT